MPVNCATASTFVHSGAGILTGMWGISLLPSGTVINSHGNLVSGDRTIGSPGDFFWLFGNGLMSDPQGIELPWDTSAAGRKQPCWKDQEEVAKIIAESLGGEFNAQREPNNWKFEIPAGLSAEDMTRAMNLIGADRFYKNLDVKEHGISSLPFISGSHFETKFRGNWYHFIFIGGTVRDLKLQEFHYEIFQPSSTSHVKDVVKTGGKTSGEVPCT